MSDESNGTELKLETALGKRKECPLNDDDDDGESQWGTQSECVDDRDLESEHPSNCWCFKDFEDGDQPILVKRWLIHNRLCNNPDERKGDIITAGTLILAEIDTTRNSRECVEALAAGKQQCFHCGGAPSKLASVKSVLRFIHSQLENNDHNLDVVTAMWRDAFKTGTLKSGMCCPCAMQAKYMVDFWSEFIHCTGGDRDGCVVPLPRFSQPLKETKWVWNK